MSALAPKIGPLGLSPKKGGDGIAEATSDGKDVRITVKLTIQYRQAQTDIAPPASALIVTPWKNHWDKKKIIYIYIFVYTHTHTLS